MLENWPDVSVESYLNKVARPTPRWGAGSVAAVTIAGAWGLIEMVTGIAHRKEPSSYLAQVITRARFARQQLLGLALEDAEALKALMATPDPAHYFEACRVPLDIRRWALEGLETLTLPVLAGHTPSKADRSLAEGLFQTVIAATEAIIQDNWPGLSPEGQRSVRDRLERLS